MSGADIRAALIAHQSSGIPLGRYAYETCLRATYTATVETVDQVAYYLSEAKQLEAFSSPGYLARPASPG